MSEAGTIDDAGGSEFGCGPGGSRNGRYDPPVVEPERMRIKTRGVNTWRKASSFEGLTCNPWASACPRRAEAFAI
jgi:hypothetical protein